MVDDLFEASRKIKILNRNIKSCRRCKDNDGKPFNILGKTESAPGFGNLLSPFFFIGQSLCTECMDTQIPFTKGSGYYIDAALELCGLWRKDVFISNLVHCHPKDNAVSKIEWIANCQEWLKEELKIVNPMMVIAMGANAIGFMKTYYEIKNFRTNEIFNSNRFDQRSHTTVYCLGVTHPASFLYKGGRGGSKWIATVAAAVDAGIDSIGSDMEAHEALGD